MCHVNTSYYYFSTENQRRGHLLAIDGARSFFLLLLLLLLLLERERPPGQRTADRSLQIPPPALFLLITCRYNYSIAFRNPHLKHLAHDLAL